MMHARQLLLFTVALAVLGFGQGAEVLAGGKGTASLGKGTGSVVGLKTNHGEIHIQLFRDKAPKTVESFLSYVRRGHFKGTLFHRVIDNFMIQGGGLDRNLRPLPTQKPVPNEASSGLKNIRGTVAMARTADPHSATSQFFVNLKHNTFLNHRSPTPEGWGYCVFGKVVKGMDVVDRIAKLATSNQGGHQNVPVTPVIIENAWIVK